MKRDTTMTIIMMIIFTALVIVMMIFVSNRNQQIDNGKLEVVYQYGGDL